MNQLHVEQSLVIDARIEAVYAVIADYNVGHRAILPKPYFEEMIVEKGGYGAGTVITVKMNIFGNKITYREVVSEPEPGRYLVETDESAGLASSFRFEPLDGGKYTRVTLASDFKTSPGFKGLMERYMNPPIMRHIFKRELQNLAAYMQNNAVVTTN